MEKDPAKTRSVLIVEDDPDTSYTFRLLLERAGYRVEVAGSAASALATLRHMDIDVVVCDLGLPGGMSGFDLAVAMQHEAHLKHIPLIALTGYGQADDRKRTMAEGFAAHLVKPVDFPVLEQALNEALSSRRRPANGPRRCSGAKFARDEASISDGDTAA